MCQAVEKLFEQKLLGMPKEVCLCVLSLFLTAVLGMLYLIAGVVSHDLMGVAM